MGCGASSSPQIFQLIEEGNVNEVRNEMRANPKVTSFKNDIGDNVLHHAAWREKGDEAKCMSALLESNVSMNETNSTGWTAAHMAAAHGKHQALRVLLTRGAKGDVHDPAGTTILHLAADRNHQSCIRAALECGVDADLKNALSKETALHVSARKGFAECVQLLIEGKASVMHCECERTPLHEAAIAGQTDVARILVKSGADSQARDSAKKTPAQLAEEAGFKKLAVELGAKVKEEDVVRGKVAAALGGGGYHTDDPEGWTQASKETCARVQKLMDETWKDVTTRDRNYEGVARYEVVLVQQNSRKGLWEKYKDACTVVSHHYVEKLLDIKTVIDEWEEFLEIPRDPVVNEFFLFHGTKPSAAAAICEGGFNVDLSGSNKGSLYGPGIYLAESSAKADEYAGDDTEGIYKDLYAMLLCRASLGNPIMNDEVVPDVEAITRDFEDTSKHSVVGDREKARGTYREFVVRNPDQVYPAYAIIYKRVAAS